MRVSAGRSCVQPGLASALTERNHILDDLFKAETIVVKERKKRSDEDSENSEDEVGDDDGYLNTERVGVSLSFRGLEYSHQNWGIIISETIQFLVSKCV